MNDSVAQTTSSSSPIRDFVKSKLQNLNMSNTMYYTVLEVQYESPRTIILFTSGFFVIAGEVIDFAKQLGYDIDSVTVYTQEDKSTVFNQYYHIFMSKR